ncbi:hypothetical protein PIROE2DRAFT_6848 [Piromyces sp. E2]|nr:hypothetical protein PIROE2DRAFT_6848 [Piromyces sp. E2]|eukprot:OUM66050.1 hypothetical protein PIROE2DRAFT_6848 [Piromyces sp. E2]
MDPIGEDLTNEDNYNNAYAKASFKAIIYGVPPLLFLKEEFEEKANGLTILLVKVLL